MEYSQSWNYPLHEAIYNPAPSTSVSSYFTRPNKVVKSGSRNSSPRNLGRRKTTTSATTSSRNRSVVDHLRSSSQQQLSLEGSRSRPVSWHPNSIDTLHIPVDSSADPSAWDFSTAQVNGLITPMSYPAMNEPQIQEVITPLDGYSGRNMSFDYGNQAYFDQSWIASEPTKGDPYALSTFYQAGYPPAPQPYAHANQQLMTSNVPTAPSSPDCPPFPNIDLDNLSLGTTSGKAKVDSEELVGMGLYDSPAEVQSSSLLFGRFSQSGQKSLKLAESFEPVEQDEDADEDDEDAAHEQESESNDSSMTAFPSYESQSIANHMAFGTQTEVDPLAYKYLATLSQLNNYYAPSQQCYGWI